MKRTDMIDIRIHVFDQVVFLRASQVSTIPCTGHIVPGQGSEKDDRMT